MSLAFGIGGYNEPNPSVAGTAGNNGGNATIYGGGGGGGAGCYATDGDSGAIGNPGGFAIGGVKGPATVLFEWIY